MARSERVGWIEHTRAIGACAVALLHVLVSTQSAADMSAVHVLVYNLVNITLCRWAVPAFFMITGMLLLDPGRPLGWDRAWRYARRMLVILATFGLLFACVQEVWSRRAAGIPITWEVFPASIVDVLTMNTWTHLWYVYALLGVYVLMPLVHRVWAWRAGRGAVLLTTGLVIAGLVFPTVNGSCEMLELPHVTMPEHGLVTYVGYLLSALANVCVGGLLRTRLQRKWPMVVGALCLVTMLGVESWAYAVGSTGWWFLSLHTSVLPCGYAMAVLLLFRRVFGDEPVRPESLVGKLAQDSFGVYVIHPVFIHVGLILIPTALMVPVVYEVSFALVAVALSALVTRALRHVPVFRGVL